MNPSGKKTPLPHKTKSEKHSKVRKNRKHKENKIMWKPPNVIYLIYF